MNGDPNARLDCSDYEHFDDVLLRMIRRWANNLAVSDIIGNVKDVADEMRGIKRCGITAKEEWEWYIETLEKKRTGATDE